MQRGVWGGGGGLRGCMRRQRCDRGAVCRRATACRFAPAAPPRKKEQPVKHVRSRARSFPAPAWPLPAFRDPDHSNARQQGLPAARPGSGALPDRTHRAAPPAPGGAARHGQGRCGRRRGRAQRAALALRAPCGRLQPPPPSTPLPPAPALAVDGWLDLAKLVAGEGSKGKGAYDDLAFKIGGPGGGGCDLQRARARRGRR